MTIESRVDDWMIGPLSTFDRSRACDGTVPRPGRCVGMFLGVVEGGP